MILPPYPVDLTARLTANFTVAEVFHSDTADMRGICNFPEAEEIFDLRVEAATNLAVNVLQRIRIELARAVNVSSWYRSDDVNRAVKGASGSQHLYAEAADVWVVGLSAKELFDWIRSVSAIQFDQVIVEKRVDARGGKHEWVHVSHSDIAQQRRLALTSPTSGVFIQV